MGLLANLCSLCTFNLCSVEETNLLGTSLKLEVSEQRTIPFPSPFHVDWLLVSKSPFQLQRVSSCPSSLPLLLELDSLVSCCCFLAMLALRSTMVFLHVFYWLKKKKDKKIIKKNKQTLKKKTKKKKYFRSVLTIVLSCTEPRSLESSRDKVCYAAPSFLRVWFVPMPLLLVVPETLYKCQCGGNYLVILVYYRILI